jgi:hypothetical protein
MVEEKIMEGIRKAREAWYSGWREKIRKSVSNDLELNHTIDQIYTEGCNDTCVDGDSRRGEPIPWEDLS